MEKEKGLVAKFHLEYAMVLAAWGRVNKSLEVPAKFSVAISVSPNSGKSVVIVGGKAHEIMMLIGALADFGEDGLASVSEG